MASLTHARALSQEDGEVLSPIDQSYALTFELEPVLTRGSLNFYTRSGHSFVAVKAGEVSGFVLAQAVWNGTRPTVYINRLAVVEQGDDESRLALIEAVTKSAYDAAVYDLQAQLAAADQATRAAFESKQYKEQPLVMLERVLGSRGLRERINR